MDESMKNETSKVLRAKVLGIMLALVLAISVIASVNSSEAAAKKSKIKLSSSKVTVVALKTTQLTLKDGTKKIKSGVKWTSSNKKIATVNVKGLVTAKTPGKVKITALYKGKKYVCNVTVKAPALKLNKKTAVIKPKETVKLSLLNGSKALTSGVKWTSSAPAVASVNAKGVVTAKKGGSANITATAFGKKYVCKVTVAVPQLKTDKATVKSGGGTCKVEIECNGDKITNGVTFKSENPSIATVDANGVVTGKLGGTTRIVANYNGGTYVFTVTIDGFNPDRDLAIEYGTDTIHIDFDLKTDEDGNPDPAEVKELQEMGCTVVGKNVQKDQVCETVRYKFKRLPSNLEEIKSLFNKPEKNDTVDLKSKNAGLNYGGFNAMAATICAANTFKGGANPGDPLGRKDPVRDLFEEINGHYEDDNIAMVQMDTGITSMKAAIQANGENVYKSYFEGASYKNNYTPNSGDPVYPYIIDMYKGPYFIDETLTITGTRPTTYMIFVPGRDSNCSSLKKCDGFASDKYIDVWYSNTDQRWYSFQNNFMHIIANNFVKPEKPR